MGLKDFEADSLAVGSKLGVIVGLVDPSGTVLASLSSLGLGNDEGIPLGSSSTPSVGRELDRTLGMKVGMTSASVGRLVGTVEGFVVGFGDGSMVEATNEA